MVDTVLKVSEIHKELIEYYEGDILAATILQRKYLHSNEKRPSTMWKRVAKAIASVEKQKNREFWYDEFHRLLKDWAFIPGGRIMYGAGLEKRVSLSNCYFIPIVEDSLKGIYRWLAESSQVYSTGGGVGVDVSILRPYGSAVKTAGGTTPGPVGFMNLMSESTNTISQAGRRGALMITMDVSHPDIERFIECKQDMTQVKHANISVKITDDFMKAVEQDTDFQLMWGGKKFDLVPARQIWNKIIHSAWMSAEPGVIFWSHMVDDHNVEYAMPLAGTNPCAEIPLPPYDACNLGHINISQLVKDDNIFDYDELATMTKVVVRFMDNVIQYNTDRHALPAIAKAVNDSRRVGIGITGLADALVKLRYRYDDDASLDFATSVMEVIKENAYQASAQLALERGPFKKYKKKAYLSNQFIKTLSSETQQAISDNGVRNGVLLTIAPVGTGSIVARTSAGIEPIYLDKYVRNVKNDDGKTFSPYEVIHPILKQLYPDGKYPAHVVTAHQVDHVKRIQMQSLLQEQIDSAISSTVNLPEETTEEEISNIYISAWKANLKGVTIYRANSRNEAILESKTASVNGSAHKLLQRVFARTAPNKRPVVLPGYTFKIPVSITEKVYITINGFPDDPQRPFELFCNSYTGTSEDTMKGLTMSLSAVFKAIPDIDFIIKKFRRVKDPAAGAWFKDVFEETPKQFMLYSTCQAIALALEKFKLLQGVPPETESKTGKQYKLVVPTELHATEEITIITGLDICPSCNRETFKHDGGCSECITCGYTTCG